MPYKIAFWIFDHFSNLLLGATSRLSIAAGPFNNMVYIHGAVGSSFLPKLLGTYELEIAKWFLELPHFQLGLDVGAAEGYYAVGLLDRNICDKVVAWEMNPEGRRLLESLATANGVRDRLDIRGRCDVQELEKTIAANGDGDVLVVIDCEGFEGELVPALPDGILRRCVLIIETHNPMNPGVHELLKKRLHATHEIVETFPKARSKNDLPQSLTGLLNGFRLPVFRRLAMSERRCPDLGWLLCRPKLQQD
jgi:hypothetical protein